jgi:hypothetical protein
MSTPTGLSFSIPASAPQNSQARKLESYINLGKRQLRLSPGMKGKAST